GGTMSRMGENSRVSRGSVPWLLVAGLVGGACSGGNSGSSAQAPGGDAGLDAESDGTPGEGGGGSDAITFAPSTRTQANDFLLTLSSSSSSATLCYTLDGSTPACSAGACRGTSQA